ncbi:hypothetical protein [Kitasatospora sp. MBT66]|uniref:hypothetical protein n=1 Tax=Kitasatospora sp. MBT66 TaxID=1444769 RepID=UPI0007C7A726|nr:hypothetical protein [Kitasatospora sp. MBT66]
MSTPPTAPSADSMIHLAEILQHHPKLRQRRFELLPLRGPGAAFTEPQGRAPGEATPPAELADLISTISVMGQLGPVMAEEITTPGGAPSIRLVTGERRYRAMRWGAVNRPDNPHFASLAAIICPGPLSEEERHMWRFTENFARENLKPGEQAAALMYHRCAVLVGRLLRAGKPVPAEVYGITDSVDRFNALERIRGNDPSCAAPWPDVLTRLGLQLSERKATELVRAFRELPRELTLEMDEQAVRLHTRIRFAELLRGREDAAAGIWAALKGTKRLDLLPTAIKVGLEARQLDTEEILEVAQERQDAANASRRTKLSRVPDLPAGDPSGADVPETSASVVSSTGSAGHDPRQDAPDDALDEPADSSPEAGTPDSATGDPRQVAAPTVRRALDGLRELLAELRTGSALGRYDEGSLRLAIREIQPFLTSSATIFEGEKAA